MGVENISIQSFVTSEKNPPSADTWGVGCGPLPSQDCQGSDACTQGGCR